MDTTDETTNETTTPPELEPAVQTPPPAPAVDETPQRWIARLGLDGKIIGPFPEDAPEEISPPRTTPPRPHREPTTSAAEVVRTRTAPLITPDERQHAHVQGTIPERAEEIHRPPNTEIGPDGFPRAVSPHHELDKAINSYVAQTRPSVTTTEPPAPRFPRSRFQQRVRAAMTTPPMTPPPAPVMTIDDAARAQEAGSFWSPRASSPEPTGVQPSSLILGPPLNLPPQPAVDPGSLSMFIAGTVKAQIAQYLSPLLDSIAQLQRRLDALQPQPIASPHAELDDLVVPPVIID